MKLKLLFISLILISSFSLHAQEEGIFRIDGGLAYGSKSGADSNGEESGKLGWSLGLEYFFSDKVSAHVGHTRFFKSNIELDFISTNIDIWLTTIDFDLRYYFSTDPTLVYGFAGFSSVKAHAEIDGTSESAGENGFNAGLGVIFPISDKVGFNLQGKWHKLPEEGQFIGNAGLTFIIGSRN